MNQPIIPKPLKNWFVIHFVVDMVFAIPLMLDPAWFLSLLGWQTIDPLTARLAAAALFGIGIESYLGRHAGLESFKNTLNLKIIWSLAALVGIGISMLQGAQGNPPVVGFLWAVFLAFNLLWIYWRLKLNNL